MTVGKRSTSVGVMYVLVGVFFVFAVIAIATSMESEEAGLAILFGIIFALVEGIILIGYFTTPAKAIILNDDKSITLPGHKVTIPMVEVEDISFKRATARGIQYKWGKVIIKTTSRKYKVGYIAHCEDCAKTLTQKMYEYKHGVA